MGSRLDEHFEKLYADDTGADGIMIAMKIILASASPRRKELLGLITKDFGIVTREVDERAVEQQVKQRGGDAVMIQCELSRAKACAVYDGIPAEERGNVVVIGADTAVVCGDEIMGKPEDKEDARRMLTMLSGRTHEVITGVCVKTLDSEVVFTETTKVRFGDLDEFQKDLIERYINTGEPYDKAGAYGIQEGGALLVDTVEGDYFNVVGLPVRRLSQILSQFR